MRGEYVTGITLLNISWIWALETTLLWLSLNRLWILTVVLFKSPRSLVWNKRKGNQEPLLLNIKKHLWYSCKRKFWLRIMSSPSVIIIYTCVFNFVQLFLVAAPSTRHTEIHERLPGAVICQKQKSCICIPLTSALLHVYNILEICIAILAVLFCLV